MECPPSCAAQVIPSPAPVGRSAPLVMAFAKIPLQQSAGKFLPNFIFSTCANYSFILEGSYPPPLSGPLVEVGVGFPTNMGDLSDTSKVSLRYFKVRLLLLVSIMSDPYLSVLMGGEARTATWMLPCRYLSNIGAQPILVSLGARSRWRR